LEARFEARHVGEGNRKKGSADRTVDNQGNKLPALLHTITERGDGQLISYARLESLIFENQEK
jgi:hypothetical protein